MIQSHVHVLQKRGLAHDFIVADLDNETNIDHHHQKNKNITSNISTPNHTENKNNQGMYVASSSGNNPIHDIESHASDYGGVPLSSEEGRSSEALLASATLMESGMWAFLLPILLLLFPTTSLYS